MTAAAIAALDRKSCSISGDSTIAAADLRQLFTTLRMRVSSEDLDDAIAGMTAIRTDVTTASSAAIPQHCSNVYYSAHEVVDWCEGWRGANNDDVAADVSTGDTPGSSATAAQQQQQQQESLRRNSASALSLFNRHSKAMLAQHADVSASIQSTTAMDSEPNTTATATAASAASAKDPWAQHSAIVNAIALCRARTLLRRRAQLRTAAQARTDVRAVDTPNWSFASPRYIAKHRLAHLSKAADAQLLCAHSAALSTVESEIAAAMAVSAAITAAAVAAAAAQQQAPLLQRWRRAKQPSTVTADDVSMGAEATDEPLAGTSNTAAAAAAAATANEGSISDSGRRSSSSAVTAAKTKVTKLRRLSTTSELYRAAVAAQAEAVAAAADSGEYSMAQLLRSAPGAAHVTRLTHSLQARLLLARRSAAAAALPGRSKRTAAAAGAAAEHAALCAAVFDAFDADGSGTVDSEALPALLRCCGAVWPVRGIAQQQLRSALVDAAGDVQQHTLLAWLIEQRRAQQQQQPLQRALQVASSASADTLLASTQYLRVRRAVKLGLIAQGRSEAAARHCSALLATGTAAAAAAAGSSTTSSSLQCSARMTLLAARAENRTARLRAVAVAAEQEALLLAAERGAVRCLRVQQRTQQGRQQQRRAVAAAGAARQALHLQQQLICWSCAQSTSSCATRGATLPTTSAVASSAPGHLASAASAAAAAAAVAARREQAAVVHAFGVFAAQGCPAVMAARDVPALLHYLSAHPGSQARTLLLLRSLVSDSSGAAGRVTADDVAQWWHHFYCSTSTSSSSSRSTRVRRAVQRCANGLRSAAAGGAHRRDAAASARTAAMAQARAALLLALGKAPLSEAHPLAGAAAAACGELRAEADAAADVAAFLKTARGKRELRRRATSLRCEWQQLLLLLLQQEQQLTLQQRRALMLQWLWDQHSSESCQIAASSSAEAGVHTSEFKYLLLRVAAWLGQHSELDTALQTGTTTAAATAVTAGSTCAEVQLSAFESALTAAHYDAKRSSLLAKLRIHVLQRMRPSDSRLHAALWRAVLKRNYKQCAAAVLYAEARNLQRLQYHISTSATSATAAQQQLLLQTSSAGTAQLQRALAQAETTAVMSVRNSSNTTNTGLPTSSSSITVTSDSSEYWLQRAFAIFAASTNGQCVFQSEVIHMLRWLGISSADVQRASELAITVVPAQCSDASSDHSSERKHSSSKGGRSHRSASVAPVCDEEHDAVVAHTASSTSSCNSSSSPLQSVLGDIIDSETWHTLRNSDSSTKGLTYTEVSAVYTALTSSWSKVHKARHLAMLKLRGVLKRGPVRGTSVGDARCAALSCARVTTRRNVLHN
jgi:trimeric autotransporter adhesin